jgi:hypothetical protein
VSTTGQHTVADLLARAERERTAAAQAQTPSADPPARPRNGRPYRSPTGDPVDDRPRNGRANGSSIGEPPGGPRNGRLYGSSAGGLADDRPRNGNAYGAAPGDRWADAAPGVPASRDPLPAARDLDPPPAGRFPDVGVPVDVPPAAPRVDPAWSVYPAAAASLPPARREPGPNPAGDGSDDWTVPMAVVPPAVDPDVADGGSDLWAGDPWAAETRRIAREARAARAASDPVPSPDPAPEESWRRQPTSRRSGHRASESEPAAHGERPVDRRSRYRPAHQRPAHQRPAHGRPGADDVPPAYPPSAYDAPAYDSPAYRAPTYDPPAYAPPADPDAPPARTRSARAPAEQQPWSGRHRRPEH